MAAFVGGEDAWRQSASSRDEAPIGGARDNAGLATGLTDESPGMRAQSAPLRLVICGSPRLHGRSAAIAHELARDLLARFPEDRLELFFIAQAHIAGCIGCDGCRARRSCVIDDDMAALMALIDEAAELFLVSPVYFAGPPSQLKAMLDRLQPHYWHGTRHRPKRPFHLAVVGEGGDPHGFGPLVTICRSALAVAGFELVDVSSHIGAPKNAFAPGFAAGTEGEGHE